MENSFKVVGRNAMLHCNKTDSNRLISGCKGFLLHCSNLSGNLQIDPSLSGLSDMMRRHPPMVVKIRGVRLAFPGSWSFHSGIRHDTTAI
ncbi:MAG: hypothetical protein ABI564_11395 [Ideonella sp.]